MSHKYMAVEGAHREVAGSSAAGAILSEMVRYGSDGFGGIFFRKTGTIWFDQV
jgi:hypothetical protein